MPGVETDFTLPQKVLFRHCDPAGIVFYPRYFEMVNDTVEAFFSDVLDWPFEAMHATHAVPTVALKSEFKAVSRHGDDLQLCLNVAHLGRTSLTLAIRAWCAAELRFTVEATLVCIDAKETPTPWPGAVKTKLERQMDKLQ